MGFWEFCLMMDEEFFSKRPYLKEVAEVIESGKNAVITLPPRAGKSYLMTMYALWEKSYEEIRILRVQYNDMLAKHVAEDYCEMLNDDKNILIFRKDHMQSYRVVGACQATIDEKYDLVICDDIYQDMFLSEKELSAIKEWFTKSVLPSLDGQLIMIGSRMYVDDVNDYVVENMECEVLKFPAIIDDNGKSFCEAVYKSADLEQTKKLTNHNDFNLLYQCGD